MFLVLGYRTNSISIPKSSNNTKKDKKPDIINVRNIKSKKTTIKRKGYIKVNNIEEYKENYF